MPSENRKVVFFAIASLSVLISVVNPAWLFNAFGCTDQWAYLGHIHSFPKLRILFPGEPSGDLLPLTLPGALAYRIFTPLIANQILDLMFLTIFLCCLYLVAQKATNTATAAVVVCVASGYQYLLSAIGSDYTDGKVIPYYMLALYFTSLARMNKRISTIYIILSGFAFSLMIYTAALSVTYAPIFCLYYLLGTSTKEGALFLQMLGRGFRFLFFFISGALVATLLLGFINFTYTGDIFFFKNTIHKLLYFVGGGFSPPRLNEWLPNASWLILPLATVMANFALLCSDAVRSNNMLKLVKSIREDQVLAFLNITSFLIMVSVEVVANQWTLQFLYFDQTLPLTFLGLAAILSRPKDAEGKSYWRFELGLALALSVIVLMVIRHHAHSYINLKHAITGILPLSDYGALAFAIIVPAMLMFTFTLQKIARRWTRSAIIILVAVINLFSFSHIYPIFLHESAGPQVFTSTIKWMDFLDTIDPNRVGHFWYDETERLSPLFRQFNAVSYLNVASLRVNRTFPQLIDFSGSLGSTSTPPKPGEMIIICTERNDAPKLATDSLGKLGISVKNYTIHPYISEYASFNVIRVITK